LSEKIPVYIPKSLYEKIKLRVQSSEGAFKNVQEFVTFVLQEFVKEEEPEEAFTSEEEGALKARLRKLGYL